VVKLRAGRVQQTADPFEVDNLTIFIGLAFDRYPRAKAVTVHARVRVPLRIMVKGVGGIKVKFTR
jgi:hypothetical protein